MTLDIKMVCQLTKALKVLYVEDDLDLRTETSLFFKHFFDDISTADDGVDALEKISQTHFDLIISDINMPNMDGIEMAKQVLKKDPDQTFIFISAHDDSAHLMKLMDLGITKFIAKPFKSAQLLQTLYETSLMLTEKKEAKEHYDALLKENIENVQQKSELSDKLEDSSDNVSEVIPKVISVENSVLKPITNKSELESFDIDFSELEDIYEEIDSLVAMKCLHPENSFTSEDSSNFAKLFSRYGTILSSYQMYHQVSQKIHDLSNSIKSHRPPEDQFTQTYLFTLIESFLKVLHKWQESWNSAKENEKKLHYLDDSIITDIDTIILTWENREPNVDSAEDVDFF